MVTGTPTEIKASILNGLPLKSLLMNEIPMVGSFGVGRPSWEIIVGVIRVSDEHLYLVLYLVLTGIIDAVAQGVIPSNPQNINWSTCNGV